MWTPSAVSGAHSFRGRAAHPAIIDIAWSAIESLELGSAWELSVGAGSAFGVSRSNVMFTPSPPLDSSAASAGGSVPAFRRFEISWLT